MAGIGISLEVSGDGDRNALGLAIWEAAYAWICFEVGLSPFGRSPFGRSPSDELYYYPADTEGTGDCTVDDHSLTWWISNPAGCCERSQYAWMHWLEHTLANHWHWFTSLATEHGLTIVSEPPKRVDLVNGPKFVTLRDDLWIAGEEGLYGDDAHIPLSELTDEERARHAAALQRCQCPMCALGRLPR